MRPTLMRTLGAALTALLTLALAGCGSGTESLHPETTSAPDMRLFGHCRADDPVLNGNRPGAVDVVAEANIDGVAAKNEIAYVSADAGGPCANALFTTFDGEPSAVPLDDAVPDKHSVDVVQLQGSDRQLLLVRGEPHPRGGYMLHLFGGADRKIGEVLADGKPLLGFVATDGGAAPATASCTSDGGIATFRGTAHQPPGIVLAWDVQRTTYTLDGNTATAVSTKQVEEAAADPVLRQERPELFDPEGYFASCIVS